MTTLSVAMGSALFPSILLQFFRDLYRFTQCSNEQCGFMFRTRKSTLIKKLLSLQESSAKNTYDPTSQGLAKVFLKDIGEIEVLQLLLTVLKEGALGTTCIVVNSQDKHLTACKLWRWPLYRTMPTLKRVPICNDRCNETECLNPYHYFLTMSHSPSKTIRLDSSPVSLPITRDLSDSGICIDMCSDTFNTEDGESTGTWCNVAYWEHNQRIGALHCVNDPIVAIANNISHSGLDLSKIANDDVSRDEVTARVRKHIGSGILVSLEEDGIWLYNRSEISIFVQSPTMSTGDKSRPQVHKVLPGYALNSYHFAHHSTVSRTARTIRLSFEKGWGPGYRRQYITDAPCWLELLLSIR
ncbi:hypothetical protein ACHWQZ_G011336 [Mnemiopsis leidyi]